MSFLQQLRVSVKDIAAFMEQHGSIFDASSLLFDEDSKMLSFTMNKQEYSIVPPESSSSQKYTIYCADSSEELKASSLLNVVEQLHRRNRVPSPPMLPAKRNLKDIAREDEENVDNDDEPQQPEEEAEAVEEAAEVEHEDEHEDEDNFDYEEYSPSVPLSVSVGHQVPLSVQKEVSAVLKALEEIVGISSHVNFCDESIIVTLLMPPSYLNVPSTSLQAWGIDESKLIAIQIKFDASFLHHAHSNRPEISEVFQCNYTGSESSLSMSSPSAARFRSWWTTREQLKTNFLPHNFPPAPLPVAVAAAAAEGSSSTSSSVSKSLIAKVNPKHVQELLSVLPDASAELAALALRTCNNRVEDAITLMLEKTSILQDLQAEAIASAAADLEEKEEEEKEKDEEEDTAVIQLLGTPSAVFLYRLVRFAKHCICQSSANCLICGSKLEYEAIKPTVCSKDLCMFAHEQYGLGAALEQEILLRPQIVDMMITFACAASSGSGYSSTANMDPFPLGVEARCKAKDVKKLSNVTGFTVEQSAYEPDLDDDERGNEVILERFVIDSKPIVSLAAASSSSSSAPPASVPSSDLKPDYAKVTKVLETVPAMKILQEWSESGSLKDNLTKQCHPLAFGLLRWLVATNRSYFRPLKPEEMLPEIKTEHQYCMLSFTPEREAHFQKLKAQYGSFYGFHGSPLRNWHCIVRKGLKNYSNVAGKMLHGAAYGAGVYLAPDSGTSFSYMHSSRGWPASIFGTAGNLGCLALCEAINHPSLAGQPKPYWVIPDESMVATRYLFIFPSANAARVALDSRSVIVPPLLSNTV